MNLPDMHKLFIITIIQNTYVITTDKMSLCCHIFKMLTIKIEPEARQQPMLCLHNNIPVQINSHVSLQSIQTSQ